MKIADFLRPAAVNVDLNASGKLDVLAELGKLLAAAWPGVREKAVVTSLVERERLATTGFGDGAAIPHAKTDCVEQVCGALAISRTGIDFDAVDGRPVHIFFALLAPPDSTNDHLKALARVSRHLREPSFRQAIMSAKTATEAFEMIVEADDRD